MTELLEETIALWRDCPAGLPVLGRTFAAPEQAAAEGEFDRFFGRVQAELKALPRTRPERAAAHQRITAAFAQFGRTALGLEDRHLEVLLAGGFAAIGTSLARQARRFDPAVSTADILQASRNAWTACGLQVLLGRRMCLTPAIFAYSMLYPYTDNYLDDAAVARQEKLSFSARFGRRLGGEAAAPANERESAIWRLVEMIEQDYPRARWPQVFESLLAIHRAQEDSLRLHSAGETVDVLTLIFAKGGASVLADGYLAAGDLSQDEARFVFAWGVALQLADDLQDVRKDARDGVRTLFTQAAASGPLDELTSRTLHFARRVTQRMHELARPDCQPLQELIERSSTSLLVRSAGEAGDLFSRDYLAELETYSPFRFAFLSRQQKQLERQGGLLAKLFEAFLEGDDDEPAFPLLPRV